MITNDNKGEYTVVLRSSAGARVRQGFYVDFDQFPDGLGGVVHIRVSTRWEDIGLTNPVPRELWFAVRCPSGDMDAAVQRAVSAASGVAMLISFCVNAVVEPPAVHIAFNSSAGLSRREFMEVFRRNETGHPRMGRWVEASDLFSFGIAAFQSPYRVRLLRALAQYQVALRYWNTGSQVLALAHLYITCEVLTKAIQRFHQDRLGLTEEEHARQLGVDTAEDKWKHIAEAFTRREYIFEGDKTIYNKARKASDAFEHGSADLGGVEDAAKSVTRELFDLVRSAILTLTPTLDIDTQDVLMAKAPVDVSPFYKQITGYVVSDGPSDPERLGVESELFPALDWQSRIKSVRFEGDELQFEPEENVTVRFAPGLKFEARDFAVYGGLNPPPNATQVERPSGWGGDWTVAQGKVLDATVSEQQPDLLGDVMSLVDKASTEHAQPFPRILLFNLFGQGVAYFQSVATLVASQPTEALLQLRALTTIAARFEQMRDSNNGGAGVAARLALDAIADTASDIDKAHAARTNLLHAVSDSGVLIPEHLAPVDDTIVWRSLLAEMGLAQRAENPYGVVGLHLQQGVTPEHLGFHTKVAAGPFSDLISSAAVIAMLRLLKDAAALLDLPLDVDRADEVLKAATELNERAALVPPTPT